MDETILVVDDEEPIAEFLQLNLVREGFKVALAYNGKDALKAVHQHKPHLILLDVMLPDMDGFDICRKIRETTSVPIIFVTARDEDVDKILGLETGADDYVVKPFNPKELVARIKAILRRAVPAQAAPDSTRLTYKNVSVDLMKRRVTADNKIIDLTPREYDLLTFFLSHRGKVFSREEILREVWGSEHLEARSVDVHVRYLREKLGDPAAGFIQTVWGKGYRFGDS
jgi:DNA-binding response OmpR family regulator